MSDAFPMVAEATTVKAATVARGRFGAYVELSKPRIAIMVLVVTALGYYMALPGSLEGPAVLLLLHTLLGTGLVGGGANAWNQYAEASYDKHMERTRNRPIPSGRLSAREVLGVSVAASVSGLVYLAVWVNLAACLVAAVALLSYVFVYTPLKRVTSHCVFVGAISGALPPVIGWAAAANALPSSAWLAFAILFFWQFPHFAAISWLYREDYDRAGFPLLSVIDPDGSRTCMQMISHTFALLVASLLPTFYGLTGMTYAVAAVCLGLAFLGCGVAFVLLKTKAIARVHLAASIIYLPSLFGFMMLDKVLVN